MKHPAPPGDPLEGRGVSCHRGAAYGSGLPLGRGDRRGRFAAGASPLPAARGGAGERPGPPLPPAALRYTGDTRLSPLERPVNSADPGASRAPEIMAPPADGLERPSGFVGKLLRIRTLESLHLREYRLLWLGQGGNAMGMWMDQIARGWLIYELTDSTVQLGLVTALRAVPLLLLSPVAGALADRYDRKAQLIIALAVDGASHALMAVLIVSGLIEPWHVYATGAVTSIASVFEQPVRQAMVANVVDRRRLTNAIGLDSMVFNVSRSTGPALAGALIALAGTGASYTAQAAFYLLATLLTMQLRPLSPARLSHAARASSPETSDGRAGRAAPRTGGHRRGHSLVSATLEGWRYVVAHETVRTAIL